MKTSLFIPLRSAASVVRLRVSFHILAKVSHVPQTMTRRICRLSDDQATVCLAPL